MDNLNIEKFSPTKVEINALAERCKGLVIKDINDKQGYLAVHQARMELKNARVNLKKTGKEARAEALAYQKKVIDLEKELIAIIEPTERDLEEKQKNIDLQKEMIKRQEILPDRKDKLLEINVEIEDNFILVMDDNEFDSFFNSKKEEYLFEKEKKQVEAQEKIDEDKRQLEEAKQIKEASDKATKEAQEKAIEDAKEAKLKAEKDVIDAIKKAEDDKAKAIQDEKDNAKAREDKIIADQKAIDDKRIADEKAEEQRKEDKRRQEKEEQEKLEKQKKYQKFLLDNGYNEENKNDYLIKNIDDKVILYKKVNEFIK